MVQKPLLWGRDSVVQQFEYEKTASDTKQLKLLAYREIKERANRALEGKTVKSERVPVDIALGRVCAELVKTRVNLPAWSVSAMDGYAVASFSTASASLTHP